MNNLFFYTKTKMDGLIKLEDNAVMYNIVYLNKTLNCNTVLSEIKPMFSNAVYQCDVKHVNVLNKFVRTTQSLYYYLNYTNVIGAYVVVTIDDSEQINKYINKNNTPEIFDMDDVVKYVNTNDELLFENNTDYKSDCVKLFYTIGSNIHIITCVLLFIMIIFIMVLSLK